MHSFIARFFIVPLFLIIVGGLNANARSYYVSVKGNRFNNGLTPKKTKNNLQDVANITKPGDTVFVMDGIYRNSCPTCNLVTISRTGKKNKDIVYRNYPGQHPILSFNGWAAIAIEKGASYIQIIGFEIEGNNSKVNLAGALRQPGGCVNRRGAFDPKYNGNGIVVNGNSARHSHHIIIVGNTVHDCGGGGIGASQADYLTVQDNLVYNTSWYSVFGTSGISFYQFQNTDNVPGYHNVIRRNRCFNNKSMVPCIKSCTITDGNGIIVDDFRNWQNKAKPGSYKARTLIEDNICWYNGGTAIHTFQSDHIDIVNNTAYCNSKTKDMPVGSILPGGSSDVQIVNNIIVVDSANVYNSNYHNSGIVYAHNLHYNITYPNQTDAVIMNATCIVGKDPEFISPSKTLQADFRLKPTSPAIDRATPNLFADKDFMGNKRPSGIMPDVGAFEFIK